MLSLLERLRRRKLFQWALAYLAGARALGAPFFLIGYEGDMGLEVGKKAHKIVEHSV